jgi:glyoxalase family protein
MNPQVLGLHHITAIANNAQRNYNFYTENIWTALCEKDSQF